ncbi:sensor histidine kinase [Phaeobacter inhibens]|uniref:sensor histidine kinase n=1 Tax=Phaeobacter inhibens TaxID=221822 RepID=UPI0021A43D88|nr:HAMP domain-containing sensor histidine kinase [Phaeobacter inhibens]
MAEDMEAAGISLPPEIEDNWSQMERLSHRMMQLVQDLLVYSTTQSESHRSEMIEPSPRLQEVLDLAGPREGFEVIIEPDMPRLRVNPIAFDMVMRNLIVNALRHHDRDHGTIILSAQSTDDAVMLSVRDDGPGIPEEHYEQIFAPFHRLSASTEGSGLGWPSSRKRWRAGAGRCRFRPHSHVARCSLSAFRSPSRSRMGTQSSSWQARLRTAVLSDAAHRTPEAGNRL